METIDLGNVAIVSKGTHDKTLTYEKLNEVQEESTRNWYRAKKNVPEQIELNSEEYWELVRDNTNVGGDENVQSDWNQTDDTADDYIKNKPDISNKFDYVSSEKPTINLNPTKDNAVALDTTTGEIFICIDNTVDENIWIGQLGTKVMAYVTPTNGGYASGDRRSSINISFVDISIHLGNIEELIDASTSNHLLFNKQDAEGKQIVFDFGENVLVGGHTISSGVTGESQGNWVIEVYHKGEWVEVHPEYELKLADDITFATPKYGTKLRYRGVSGQINESDNNDSRWGEIIFKDVE